MFGALETDRPKGGTHYWRGQHYKLSEKTKTYFCWCVFRQEWINTSLKTLPPGKSYQERLDARNVLKNRRVESDRKYNEECRNAKKVS